MAIGEWRVGNGDWGMAIGDGKLGVSFGFGFWFLPSHLIPKTYPNPSPIPYPQSPIIDPQSLFKLLREAIAP